MKKVSLTQAAHADLSEMRVKILDGYRLGSVPAQSLASWIIVFFREHYFERSISKIRKDHEDPILVLKEKIAELESSRKKILKK